MSNRPKVDMDEAELLDEVIYYYASQGPSGVSRGRRAITELLYRWGYLPDDFWQLRSSVQGDITSEMASEEAVATITMEADERGYDHDLYLPQS
jgi:hypothetical protein